mmetsp:Transcript_25138/g.87703  ORF Transcript_25138/g.87703 Transcript_25138/m.87703 type:complete len:219 (+) Transcript_25138:223-879(+)
MSAGARGGREVADGVPERQPGGCGATWRAAFLGRLQRRPPLNGSFHPHASRRRRECDRPRPADAAAPGMRDGPPRRRAVARHGRCAHRAQSAAEWRLDAVPRRVRRRQPRPPCRRTVAVRRGAGAGGARGRGPRRRAGHHALPRRVHQGRLGARHHRVADDAARGRHRAAGQPRPHTVLERVLPRPLAGRAAARARRRHRPAGRERPHAGHGRGVSGP